ncbi:MAG: hypothetical protein U9N81_00670 [Bacillota bacterium]|nr:hypothetical protein [Bacillota bacterium]
MNEAGLNWEQLRLDLYAGDLVVPALQKVLTGKGPCRTWYRASRKNISGGTREVNWFLTEGVLIRQEMNADELFFVIFELKHIIRTEKHYDYFNGKPGLKRIVFTFVDGKTCDLMAPYVQFKGDIPGFEKMISLIG